MAKKSTGPGKDAATDKNAAVELEEGKLDEVQGGIVIIGGSSTLTQKVKKIRDLGSLGSRTYKI